MADDDASLDELIEQAQALLEQEKPRKRKLGESEFEFYRDSVSGHRISKHKYRPRSRKPSAFSQSATCSSFEGLKCCRFILAGCTFVLPSPLFSILVRESFQLYSSILLTVSF